MKTRDWARYRRVCDGVDLLEAVFDRHVYERHIHETFAIGITLRGVQRFWCRGSTHDSRPGQVIVIHPGEAHDGRSGTTRDYAYRMFYVSTEKLRRVAVRASGPVVDDPPLFRALLRASDAIRSGEPFVADQRLDEALQSLDAARSEGFDRGALDHPALRRARDCLHENIDRPITVTELAAVAGMSRFRLTRQFQRVFGLPLHAFHLHVRLDEGRRRLTAGRTIADVAAGLGFVDQSHFHRRFKGAFGMTPAEWQRCTAIQDTSRDNR